MKFLSLLIKYGQILNKYSFLFLRKFCYKLKKMKVYKNLEKFKKLPRKYYENLKKIDQF